MTAKLVPEHISDERPKLTAYELQVLIGTTISGCSMSPDRTFDLPAAWARLKGLGLIDRADGIANATPAGVELVASTLTELQHRREAEAGALNVRDEIVTRILDLSVIGKALSGFTDVEGDIFADELRAIVTSALAASPSSPASGVRVKALEWREAGLLFRRTLMIRVAPVSFGRYAITKDGNEYGWLLLCDGQYVADMDGFSSEDEAKAAAQADYEARILSALGEHP